MEIDIFLATRQGLSTVKTLIQDGKASQVYLVSFLLQEVPEELFC